MDKKTLVEKLVDNTPLVIIIVGLFIFAVGAAGGWAKLQIQVNDLGGRVSLAIMGALVCLVGVALLWREKTRTEDKDDLSTTYGVRITSPGENTEVPEAFEISGTYDVRPPNGVVLILEFSPVSHHYWPKRYVVYNDKQKSWSALIQIGGKPAEKRIIVVALVGKGGQALFEYCEKVGHETKQWIGIRTLSPDVIELDKVTVKRI